ncbi:MAG: hypothetical protein R2809_13590 [Flavobacteriales bacterium]
MALNRDELKYSIQEFFNDVIEQGFHHLVNYPQNDSELSVLISDATNEMNYQLLKLDSHNFKNDCPELQKHYQSVCKDSERKSLEMLGQLQKIQHRDIPRLKRI